MENKMYNIKGYEIIKMRGDGNCLFRAMSYAIFKTEMYYHELVRREIVNYLKNNWKTVKESVENVHQINNKEDYCNFIQNQRAPK